jgi:hypothetical protein
MRPGCIGLAFGCRQTDPGAEMVGEDGGEDRRHVLDDEHRQAAQGGRADLLEHLPDRFRAAGRGTDQQDARGGHRARPRAQGHRAGQARDRGGRGLRRGGGFDRGGDGPAPGAGGAEHPDPLQEIGPEAVGGGDAAIALGLGDVVDGAEREAAQRHVGVALGQRRHHHDLHAGLTRQDQRQGLDAVEFRHLDVEQHHVRGAARQRVDGGAAVRGGGDHVVAGLAEPAGDQSAHHGGIVGDQDLDRAARRGSRGEGRNGRHAFRASVGGRGEKPCGLPEPLGRLGSVDASGARRPGPLRRVRAGAR